MKCKTGYIGGVVMLAISGAFMPASATFLSPGSLQEPLATPLTGGKALASFIAIYANEKNFAGITLSKSENNALADFYAARWNQPYWLGANGPKPFVAALLSMLRHADLYALSPADYGAALALKSGDWSTASPEIMAKTELVLMRAALLYARHAGAGRIRPRSLAKGIHVDPQPYDPAMVLDMMSSHENPAEYLKSLHPAGAEFKRLLDAYLDYRNIVARGGWPVISKGKSLTIGSKGKRVIELRRRLAMSGDLPGDEPLNNPVFDKELQQALISAQERYGIKPDGVAGAGTRKMLNFPASRRLEQLKVNLERRRWQPKDMGERHVLVNQAGFKLYVIENNKEIYSSKVIVGKPRHATPEFSDNIRLVVLNPYWNVPRSIATKEILPILRRNPGYLARKGMSLINSRGRKVSPYGVNWSRVSRRSFNYRIRQRPSGGNALGRIKFMFPNKHSIYLHDTPSKSLFNKSSRAFSHGCIRVQNPVKFAEVLMQPQFGWSQKTIAGKISTRRNRGIKLKQKIPVHLTYRTVWAGDDGKLHFRDDIYGRDKRLAKALAKRSRANKLANLRRIKE